MGWINPIEANHRIHSTLLATVICYIPTTHGEAIAFAAQQKRRHQRRACEEFRDKPLKVVKSNKSGMALGVSMGWMVVS